MDDAANTMIQNLKIKTGKSLEEWIEIVKAKGLEKHGDILKFLKSDHDFTHGYANLVSMKAREADAGSVENKSDLIEEQYQGKEQMLPYYELLKKEIEAFGKDVEFSPKRKYVSVRRKKQFAMLTPATKTRFEIGLNLKGEPGTDRLEEITAANAMCSHKINITDFGDLDKEVIAWLKMAYDAAG